MSIWLEARVDEERATMEAAISAILYSDAPAGEAASQPLAETSTLRAAPRPVSG